jgi:hypothetical protein
LRPLAARLVNDPWTPDLIGVDLDAPSVRAVLATGQAMLFTGAGFSAAASDSEGVFIPSTAEVAKEIWALCFPDEAQDDSALQDLFHYAVHHRRGALEALLQRRLRVDERTLPAFYRHWLEVPWRRIWTLNVDDIELAAARRFRFRRAVRALSALADRYDERLLEDPRRLPVIHLNGMLQSGLEGVTFSTMQYGDRLARKDPWYARFVGDLVRYPFVIVGTRLDEAPLWQHLQTGYRHLVHHRRRICRAWIVAPRLTRARRALLEDLGIRWLRMSAEQFALEVLDPSMGDGRQRTASRE